MTDSTEREGTKGDTRHINRRKLNNLDGKDQFLKKHKVPQRTQYEI